MKLYDSGVFLLEGETIVEENDAGSDFLEKRNSIKKVQFPMVSYRLTTPEQIKRI